MADSPIKGKVDLPSYSVVVDGTEVPLAYSITSIQVKKEINRIPEATLTVLDGDPSKNDFEISGTGPFKPGAEVKISLGYHQQNEVVFVGVIVGHGLKLRTEEISELVITCVDKAASMAVMRKSRYYTDMKDDDILKQVIGEHQGLTAEVDAATMAENVKGNDHVQYYASDWDYMLALAEENGLVVAIDDAKVQVKDPTAAEASEIKLKHGADIMKLDLEIDARYQVKGVKTFSWDYSKNELAEGAGKDVTLPDMGSLKGADLAKILGDHEFELKSTIPFEKTNLDAWGSAYLKKNRLSRFKGKVKFQGSSKVKHNQTVSLEGLGDNFNGTGYVSGVFHNFGEDNWTTEITLGLDPVMFTDRYRDISGPPAGGLLPGIEGLQIGVVKNIHEDPMGENRVQVEIPIIESGSAKVWARMLKYYATNEAGNFFYPEIGDEVILAFLNNDPRYPVLLGSVYSSTHVPPYTPDEENTYKAIVTNSKMKIEFEDIKRIITIWTPNENTMVFDDDQGTIWIEDENKNKITMDSAGITMYTPKDLAINVDGNMDVKVTGSLTQEATQSLKQKGLDVTSEASTSNTMKGATTEVNGSAQTTIKGGVVMIN